MPRLQQLHGTITVRDVEPHADETGECLARSTWADRSTVHFHGRGRSAETKNRQRVRLITHSIDRSESSQQEEWRS